MTQKDKNKQRKPGKNHTPPLEEANQQRQLAEAKEVAGRHKNDGQKDHKGAR